MYADERKRDEVVKFVILTKWLKERLENNEQIDSKEIKKLLSSLGIEILEKVQEIKDADLPF